MLRFCKKCVMPDTKPDLKFDESGVCNACRNFEKRVEVNWESRAKELEAVLAQYRSKNGGNWDCIIPVSGGKDSTFQVVKMLQLGMNPLCVTATTCALTEIGRKNLDNIKTLGVDHIEMSPKPTVRAKLNKIGLMQVGDISWPEHVAIFTVPVTVAVRYKVPLIIWGENSQNEYGGPATATESKILDRRWLEEFGGLLGLRVTDLEGMQGITPRDLIPYTYPEDSELKEVGITGLFLGYFVPWDGFGNSLIAQGHGFLSYDRPTEGSIVNYENLDNYQTAIHEYFKYLKFGFGRATDHACLHIRRARLSRQDGLELVKLHDGKFPWTYLGKPLHETLAVIGMTVEEFISVCDKFTNKRIFKTDGNGKLVKDNNGSLIKSNYDNL
ncbi:MAG: N-acetyl sugar amidotransferase [Proteobacteria bacterium]|nr:MAG: N-acetyl sugar amidotransferase [Pseudomonadota bacterium]